MASLGNHPRILVLGVGNPILSDDSIGLHIASELEKKISNADVKTSSLAGLDIIEFAIDYDVVIIIDALYTGGEVGKISRLTSEDFRRQHGVSSHDTGLIEAIDAGRLLFNRRIPEKIILYTIEVENVTTFSENLSPKVEAAIPEAINLIRNEIENICYDYKKKDH